MRRLFLAVIAFCLMVAPVPAAAQDADREARIALAERAIVAMEGDQTADFVQQMTAAFPPPPIEALGGRERIAFDEAMADATEAMVVRLYAAMAELYADIYSREELEALVSFYESPIGRSITEKTFAATPQLIELTRSLVPHVTRDLVNGMCDRLACTPEERQQALREALAGLGMTAS